MSSPLRPSHPIDCADCQYRTLRMFCNLSEEALAAFNSIGVPVKLPSGATIFQEDDTANAVVVVCEGQVKLSSTSKEGKTLILKIAMPGDLIGLSAVITGTKYEVTSQTLEPTLIKNIRRDEFLGFLRMYGEASMHAAQSMSAEYKTAFYDARRLALSTSAAGRLAAVLLDWGRSASCGKSEMRFTMALTHEELANLAGTSRETITRVLGKFKKDNLIQVRGSSIVIVEPERLAQIST